MKEWTSPVYAFFDPTPTIETKGDQCAHNFKCKAKGCKVKIWCFLDKKDARSTGNMHKHVKNCWGVEIVENFLKNGSITTALECKGQGKVTYSNHQHTWTEARAEIVCWVSENLWPFEIVKDREFQSLMKTGRPEYHILSPSTVLCNVRLVFAKTRQRIAKMSREYDGKLNFSTDSWTSPNHHAYIALLMHLEHKGIPLCMPLDIVDHIVLCLYTSL
ncbi:hypothetical protein BDR07DRAFT_1451332 [Suillus spraguei]|nr:hypothetical protein BDR07DRAFT_1451332 [Suillus spraguei]